MQEELSSKVNSKISFTTLTGLFLLTAAIALASFEVGAVTADYSRLVDFLSERGKALTLEDQKTISAWFRSLSRMSELVVTLLICALFAFVASTLARPKDPETKGQTVDPKDFK
jgi:hypothetical protein